VTAARSGATGSSARSGSPGTACQATGITTGATRRSAAASRSSWRGSGSGSLSTRSSTTARGAASARRSSNVACTLRRQGQRPMASMLASSMATMTTSSAGGRVHSDSPAS
jgi:hypothetical protein